MKKEKEIEQESKFKIWWEQNKQKSVVFTAIISMIILTIFNTVHYKVWFLVTFEYTSALTFALMIASLVQVVNSFNISSKGKLSSSIISTVINVIMVSVAVIYTLGFINEGFKSVHILSILLTWLGVMFSVFSNVLGYIFTGHREKHEKTLGDLVDMIKKENLDSLMIDHDE